MAEKARRRALVVPREHGAWGMLLVPLLTGAVVGLADGGRVVPVLLLTTGVLTLFWLRTPLESWFGASAVRAQTLAERRLVHSVTLPLAAITMASLGVLLWRGRSGELVGIGIIAGAAFVVQVFLKKMGRATRMAAELVGALALASTAPAAYCAATGQLDAKAWTLWLLNWLFAANQIHFVWLRIRGARVAELNERLRLGWSFLAGEVVLGLVLVVACRLSWVPQLTLVAFAPVLFRGLAWFARPPRPIMIRRLGWTELAHAVAFGFLLIAVFTLLP